MTKKEIKKTYETFVNDLVWFLNDRVGNDWKFNFAHDNGALLVTLNIDEDSLDWGSEDDDD